MTIGEHQKTIVQINRGVDVVTIASGQSISDTVKIGQRGARNLVIVLINGWTAANIGFQASYDNGLTFAPLYKANGDRVLIENIGTLALLTNRAFIIPETYGLGVATHLFLQSINTSGVLVNQAAARSFQIVPLY